MITRSETIGKLALALSKAQSAMGHAPKGKDNPFFKSRYADFTAIVDTAKPHLSANELSIAQLTDVDEKGETFLITLLMHSSGEFMQSRIKLSLGKNDQATGSSMSYMKRYCYAAIIGMATEDEDDDGEAQRKAAEEERKRLEEEKKNQDNLKRQQQQQQNKAPAKPRQPGPIAPKTTVPAESPSAQQNEPKKPDIFMTTEKWKPMHATMNAKGVTNEDLKKYIWENFKMDSTKQFTAAEYNAVMLWLRSKPVKSAQPSQPSQIKLDPKEPTFDDYDPHTYPHVLK